MAKKTVLTWTGVLGVLGALGMLSWIGPALLQSASFDPTKLIPRAEFEEYRAQHNSWGEAKIGDFENQFDAIQKNIEMQRQHDLEWRIGQGQVNERILSRLDMIIDRLPPKGHAAAGGTAFEWETECAMP